MKIDVHSVREEREDGCDVVKCATTLTIDSTFTIPEIAVHKRIPIRKIAERMHSLLTVYLSKPIEIDEESLSQQSNNQSDDGT